MNCRYIRTIFENSETGYFINVYETADKNALPAVLAQTPDPKVSFVAKGSYLPTNTKVQYNLEGEWQSTDKYGLQLNVTSFVEILPDTREGAIAYLSSGLIKGIGPKIAERIADHFGPDTFSILDHQPERLLEIAGITPKKLQAIQQSLVQGKSMRNLVTLLAPYGISTSKISRIYKQFGLDAYSLIKQRPYKLCVINGFGFKTVDQIAKTLGGQPTDPLRLSGALHYILEEAAAIGHLFLPYDQFLKQTSQLLNNGYMPELVSFDNINERLQYEVKLGDMIIENQAVYLNRYHQAETTTAECIANLLAVEIAKIPAANQIKNEIAQSSKRFGIILADAQQQAIENALRYPISIITGGPGTGKTTILKIILDIKKRLQPSAEILLTAPTGRAARRMAETTGHSAFTLHSALELVPDQDMDQDFHMLHHDLIICDEFSMCDTQLASSLFSALTPQSQIVIVGDSDQLPSVGAGNILRELIHSAVIPTTFLNQVFRQADESPIPANAQLINQGSLALHYNDDFSFISCTAIEAAELIPKLYLQYAAEFGIDQVQVLSPMKNRGEACTSKLNTAIQDRIFSGDTGTPSIKVGHTRYFVGDKVIHRKNSLLVSNGDIGTIINIYPNQTTHESVIVVTYSNGRIKEYCKEDYGQLELAYALTVHKAQGSECAVVIIPVLNEQYVMLKRNLIYTAITRAKAKVILIGEESAIKVAIKRNDVDDRNTLLAYRIKQLMQLQQTHAAAL